ncbi:putative cysteine desulfurase [Anatilimnocola aggregata]|uniref:Putative cysteine desulfurase n=1 Tax=Anatilimnocola aggregata TaxID=2528021 RepID=A0A517YMW7_9BACT|nr:cysteine desulfurase-like protein [Anatilimnocola aggregata]QDU31561.1 putative cysteine desulfurase [Anatilimnocola aggregata]
MKFNPEVVEHCRRQFPALSRRVGDLPAMFLDGPAGTQVPQRVIDAIGNYLAHNNANHGGLFATARDSDRLLDEVQRAAADFLGADDPETIYFGQNMTSLTFALSRALAKTWKPGDEIIVTRLDHDANVTPWVLAAKDAGATVHYIGLKHDDCTLDLEQFRQTINSRTKLVAVGCASNATGGVNPVRDISSWAHQAGALVFLDAVHYAPHRLIDVQALGGDFLACSAYKFFGPHTGLMWGKRELLQKLTAYKVRPAPDTLPGKWMTGTQSHESLAGVLGCIDYLADLGHMVAGSDTLDRRAALREAYEAIEEYERKMCERLMHGLSQISEIKVWGITNPTQFDKRVATVSITHDRYNSAELAERLGRYGIFSWHGNYYALQLSETLGREPAGMLRIGLVHYNTTGEVDRLLRALEEV